ncbi:gene transfer agent family protein [Celeribacter neptunius]|uniref:Phage tail tube protein, GTA-gp10 n=1 Tax=Celeribacter neptunius TaxID=588602 RepID=A0A1I3LI78_9RHOB|nr:gene transfer agent family protein [Celeribacter neptunius]SFI84471.1 Phage tail tube protein, GTA-gp10 [Celeribacter neptunius]
MNEQITYTGFFGDRDHAFCLTDPMLAELERITGLGVGALYFQFVNGAYPVNLLTEVIRLGLIGGGADPEDAKRLCDAYAANRPLSEVFPLAFEIMEARWSGVSAKDEETEVAATGDLGASLSVAA